MEGFDQDRVCCPNRVVDFGCDECKESPFNVCFTLGEQRKAGGNMALGVVGPML